MSANDHKAERLGEMGGRELLDEYAVRQGTCSPVKMMQGFRDELLRRLEEWERMKRERGEPESAAPKCPNVNTPIPDYADLFTVEEFREQCELGMFVNYDGTGYYSNPPNMDRNAKAIPSEFKAGNMKPGFTHVAWFNK